jgi:hypothetical protein
VNTIDVLWDKQQQNLLHIRFMGKWNWQQLNGALDHAQAQMAATAAPTHLLFVFEQSALLEAESDFEDINTDDFTPSENTLLFVDMEGATQNAEQLAFAKSIMFLIGRAYPSLARPYKMVHDVSEAQGLVSQAA